MLSCGISKTIYLTRLADQEAMMSADKSPPILSPSTTPEIRLTFPLPRKSNSSVISFPLTDPCTVPDGGRSVLQPKDDPQIRSDPLVCDPAISEPSCSKFRVHLISVINPATTEEYSNFQVPLTFTVGSSSSTAESHAAAARDSTKRSRSVCQEYSRCRLGSGKENELNFFIALPSKFCML